MSAPHTPGPWTARFYEDQIAGEAVIHYDVSGPGSDHVANVWDVNDAALVAAAPELLRGCQAALAYLADPPSVFPENRTAAIDIIRQAIRAATTPPTQSVSNDVDLTNTAWDRYGDEGAWFQIAADDTEIHIVNEGDGLWVRHLDGEGGGATPLDHKGPFRTLGEAVIVGNEWLARIDAVNLQP